MTHILPPLPYAIDALEPYISANTLSFHHGKHHQTYVTNLNNLIPNTSFAQQSLEEIIVHASSQPDYAGIFNNAAQVWNHTFYWNCMKSKGGGQPNGDIAQLIDRDLGGYDKFRTDFKQAATTQFGSGWAWLVLEDNHLKIIKTGNADLPMIHGQKAVLTCDVWEHAYYLDYQNRRADYVDIFLDHLVNWDFANAQL
ncbi:superoxide dismutase [Candidatus Finniella inopinata]|uniref:Superoxide dismutase n=1 Tax=Candidatus Finniella inopinata TaxID=1696036 RepID=A0A4Q7DIQ8_9PROT|nr:superoxide dismutase [Candidatus Finniella inopinata]RZI46188.1 superoxide dismutase [Candidatus Finniella inopinata]